MDSQLRRFENYVVIDRIDCATRQLYLRNLGRVWRVESERSSEIIYNLKARELLGES